MYDRLEQIADQRDISIKAAAAAMFADWKADRQ